MDDGFGGITRSGGAGSFSYSAISGRADMPVVDISYYDTLRFANWMQNGQPNTGSQTSATTEDGTYTFSGIQSVGPRHAGAAIALRQRERMVQGRLLRSDLRKLFRLPDRHERAVDLRDSDGGAE
jgi:hypothetical protein